MTNVLVVDDDPEIAEFFADALREGGFSVECALRDLDAYRRISSVPTLCGLVLDVNLGTGTTGFDVGRFARQVIPKIAVIYVSGQAPRDSYGAFGVPFSAFLQKPFAASELVDILTALTWAPNSFTWAPSR
jgi:DNA-binding response OmpR family regulator